jgi:uncharacterized integral membrane protein
MKIEEKLTALGRLLAIWAAGSFLSFILIVLCVSLLSYVFGIGDREIPVSIWEFSGAVVGGLILAGEEQRIWELQEELKRGHGQKGGTA